MTASVRDLIMHEGLGAGAWRGGFVGWCAGVLLGLGDGRFLKTVAIVGEAALVGRDRASGMALFWEDERDE